MAKKKLLVVGGTGFIGSHFLKLAHTKYEITLLKRKTSNIKRIESVLSKITVCDLESVDLNDFFTINKFNQIINFATNYGRGEVKLPVLLETNLIFPLSLIEIGLKHNLQNYINIDTSLEYKVNAYAYSKHLLRETLKDIYAPRISILNLQLEYVYGPDDDKTKFLPFAVDSLRHNRPINMSLGEQELDFVHVKDCVSAILHLLDQSHSFLGFKNFEIGSGKTHQLKKIILSLKNKLQSESKVNFGTVPYRQHEQMFSKANIKAIVGWQPKYLKFDFETLINEKKNNT